MSLVIPFTFVGGPGNKAKASEVNANFAAVAAKFSTGAGGILDEDCSTSMALRGTKMSTTPGNRIPLAAMEDDAVDERVLRDSASIDGNRSVTANHIKTDAVITRIIKLGSVGFTPGGTLGANSNVTFATGVSASTRPLGQHIQSAAGASAESGKLSFLLIRNTTSGDWDLQVANLSTSTADLTGMSFILQYVPSS